MPRAMNIGLILALAAISWGLFLYVRRKLARYREREREKEQEEARLRAIGQGMLEAFYRQTRAVSAVGGRLKVGEPLVRWRRYGSWPKKKEYGKIVLTVYCLSSADKPVVRERISQFLPNYLRQNSLSDCYVDYIVQ